MKTKTKIASLLLTWSFSLASQATVFNFEDLNANNGGISDRLDTIHSSFDDNTEQFSWDVDFNSDPTDVDGFWLVVNNGPNPKSADVNELAIMYGDMATGTLTTYVYNGLNNANSFINPAIYLQTDTFAVDSSSISIDIDATAINAWNGGGSDYSGISFDENIGIWFHVSTDSSFEYLDGMLESYSYGSQGWYDKKNLTATVVPEPGSLALLGLGLAGLGFSRRRAK